MKTEFLLGIVCSLITLCNANFSVADTRKGNAEEITEISLERTSCLGMCPADEVVLRSDGNASYIGKSVVKQIGVFTGYIPSYTFKALSEFIISQRFFDMQSVPPKGPPETDGTFINVVRGGKVKTINLFDDTPREQWLIAIVIRGITADIDWQKHKAGVHGVLTAKTITDKAFLVNKLISIQRYATGHPILYITTDANANFEIDLPPGAYFFTVGTPPQNYGEWSDSDSQMLIVKPNTFTDVKIEYKPKPK